MCPLNPSRKCGSTPFHSNENYSRETECILNAQLIEKMCFYSIYRDSDLLQRDWSALSDDDLKLFGFENESLRREMLVKFANTPNQVLHYEKFVRIENIQLVCSYFWCINFCMKTIKCFRFLEKLDADQYRGRVYKNVQDQLQQLNKILLATESILHANPIQRDKLANDSVYVSTLSKKTIEEIFKVISRITKSADTKRWNIWIYSIVTLSVFGSLTVLRKLIKN